jgi:hypothetical protein
VIDAIPTADRFPPFHSFGRSGLTMIHMSASLTVIQENSFSDWHFQSPPCQLRPGISRFLGFGSFSIRVSPESGVQLSLAKLRYFGPVRMFVFFGSAEPMMKPVDAVECQCD